MYPQSTEEEAFWVGINIPNIKNLSFSRSKNTPSNTLTVGIFGAVHTAVRPGNWIVLRSSAFVNVAGKLKNDLPISAPANGELFEIEDGIPRFIGQISSVQTSYTADDTGNIRRITTVGIREWSDIFNIAVRYDDFSIQDSIAKNANASGITAKAANIAEDLGFDNMEALTLASYSAFGFAQLCLRLVDAINSSQMDNPELKKLNFIYPELSSTMPKIPRSMLDNLGIPRGSTSNFSSSNFLTRLFGILKNPLPGTLSNFFGIYNSSLVNDMAKAGESNEYFTREPSFRPIATGLVPLLFQGLPVWQILKNHTDPSIHEIFTDFTYTYTEKNGRGVIGARPTIFMRDRPFLLKDDADGGGRLGGFQDPSSSGGIKGEWTYYDQLPRITIDTAFIKSFVVGNSFTSSPNYVRLNFSPGVLGTDVSAKFSQQAAFAGPIFKAPEMSRFGGYTESAELSFLPQNIINSKKGDVTSIDVSDFYKTLKFVLDKWHTQLYKTASISLNLKDPGYPMTVGHNLSFKLGDRYLVGHIDSISTNSVIDEDAKWMTSTQIELSRVVQCFEDGGKLSYIPIHEMFNLLGETIPPEPDSYNTKKSNARRAPINIQSFNPFDA